MKRKLCLMMSLLMVFTLLTSCAETVQISGNAVPLEGLPEEFSQVEPISAPVVEAEAQPAAEPVVEPVVEPVAETVAEPAAETAAEVPAEVPTEAPMEEAPAESASVETPQDAAAAEPATIDAPSAEDPGLAVASLEPEAEKVTVKLWPDGGVFPNKFDSIKGFIEVTLDENRILTYNDPETRQPTKKGFTFAGWYTGQGTEGDKVELNNPVPQDVTELYAHWDAVARTVLLKVINGNFGGEWDGKSGEDLAKEASVTVTLEGNVLPLSVNTIVPTRTNGTFEGWYTAAPSEENKSGDGFSYWFTTAKKGTKVIPGEEVPADVEILYAVFENKEAQEEADKHVTFYLDWNGINGMWGNCLTLSREYSEADGGYKLTAGDLAVRYLNWDGEHDSSFDTQESLTNYWSGKKFNGYTFLGWASAPTMMEPDVTVDCIVKDGDVFYAVWTTEDGAESKDFNRTDPDAGPMESMHIEGKSGYHTSGSLDWSAHLGEGSTLTFGAATAPARATFKTLTWTVDDGKNSTTVTYKTEEPTPVTVQLNDKISLTASGKDLTIAYTGDNTARDTISLTVNVSAGNMDGGVINNSQGVSKAIFAHNWQETGSKKATCTEDGFVDSKCSTCQETKHEVLKAGHNWEVDKSDSRTHPPTCDEPGQNFMRCNYVDANGKRCEETEIWTYGSALGHSWNTKVTTTCTGQTTIKTCTRCGHTEITEDNTKGKHSYNSWYTVDKAATCSTEGSMSKHCSKCEAVTDSKIIPVDKNNHTWGEWTVASQATVDVAGVETRTCTGCNLMEQRTIPKIPTEWRQRGGQWYWYENNVMQVSKTVDHGNYYVGSNGAMRTGWIALGGGDYYYANGSGVILKNQWVCLGGVWYWLKADGLMAHNETVTLGNAEYMFTASGALRTGWIALDGGDYYYANSSGVILKNQWVCLGGVWYWMKADGKMARNETVRIGGADYMFTGSGAMRTGWIALGGGDYYYANGSGAILKNQWVKSGAWYWMKADGKMARNETVRIGGADYMFTGSGAMRTGWIALSGGDYYYANGSGALVKNQWVWSGAYCYYLKSDGLMARNEWIGSYYVNNSGAWVR